MDGATGVVSTHGAVIGMLLMAGHDETVEIAAVAIGIVATDVSALKDAAAAVVAASGIRGRAAIDLPRTHKAAVGARVRAVARAKGVGTGGIGAMEIALIPVAARATVMTSTAARAIALKVAVVTVTAVKEIVLRVVVARASAPTAIVVMATAAKEIALKVAVATATAARAIALRAAAATLTAARAVTSIAMAIVRATSTAEAAMPANPVSPCVLTSKLIAPSIRRQRWQVARVMLALCTPTFAREE